ncbi:MAG: tetratricopeptide repeat protein [Gemmatimonadales bacterium]
MKAYRSGAAVLALGLLTVPAAFAQQTAEELYQAGLYQEEVQGDLERAIEVYRRILEDFPSSRAVGAKAQLHIGLCYEKLGLQEARQAYRSVIDDFPDHTDEVEVARNRLAGIERALAALNRQPTFRKIEIASEPQNGVLSPDGKRLAFISEGAVWVVPLHGRVDPDIAGEPVRLAEVPGVWDNGSLLAWSANGGWIAVNGGSEEEDDDAVSLIPVKGGDTRVVNVPNRGSHAWSYRLSLSPDGGQVAVSAVELGQPEAPFGRNKYIYSIPVGGGAPTQISSGSARMPSFSPDGKLIAYVGARERDDWEENTERTRFDGDLWVASSTGSNPRRLATVDGQLRGPVWSPDGRYIAAHHEPGNSNFSQAVWVFPLSPDASSAGEPTKIALPRESWEMVSGWTPDGKLGVFIDSEMHEAIYTVPASGGKAVQVMAEGGDPYYPRWSPDGERIYLRGYQPDPSRVFVQYVPASGGDLRDVPVRSERELVSTIPGGGLNVSPDGKRIVIAAYQKPYDPEEGVDIWAIPLDGGTPTRLTTDASFEGYPCWSPDGEWIAFTDRIEKSEDEGFRAIFMVPAEGGEIRRVSSESDSVSRGGITFSPDGERIAFFSNGQIKAIPLDGGRAEVLTTEVQSRMHSDLAWSPDGARVAYSGAGKIWIASIGGGPPEELRTGLPEGARLSTFSWSPDGEKIAFVGSIGGDGEFWLISDFLPTSEDR